MFARRHVNEDEIVRACAGRRESARKVSAGQEQHWRIWADVCVIKNRLDAHDERRDISTYNRTEAHSYAGGVRPLSSEGQRRPVDVTKGRGLIEVLGQPA